MSWSCEGCGTVSTCMPTVRGMLSNGSHWSRFVVRLVRVSLVNTTVEQRYLSALVYLCSAKSIWKYAFRNGTFVHCRFGTSVPGAWLLLLLSRVRLRRPTVSRFTPGRNSTGKVIRCNCEKRSQTSCRALAIYSTSVDVVKYIDPTTSC